MILCSSLITYVTGEERLNLPPNMVAVNRIGWAPPRLLFICGVREIQLGTEISTIAWLKEEAVGRSRHQRSKAPHFRLGGRSCLV